MPTAEELRPSEYAVRFGDDPYVVCVAGDRLRIGRAGIAGIDWLDATVSMNVLGGEARRALELDDRTCPALLIGLRSVVAHAVLGEST